MANSATHVELTDPRASRTLAAMGLPAAGAPCSPALFFGREEALARHASEMPRVRLSVVYGVGGVGKTAFVLRATEELADRIGARRAYVRCRPGESASTLAAAVAPQLAPTATGPAVETIARAGTVALVIDDAHLGGAAVAELAEYLVTRSRTLHVTVASRSTLPLSPVAVDHLVIKLGGLDATATRELWSALEALYGKREASARDERAPIAGGNPLLIKRAFADLQIGDDPLGLAELTDFQRVLLLDLCALRRVTTRGALAEGRDAADVEQALGALERRFLIEVAQDRHGNAAADVFGVHDLIREAVNGSRWRPGPEVHSRWIDHSRARAALEESSGIELFYHCVAAGRDDAAVDLLRVEAEQLRRVPPSNALLDREIRDAIDQLDLRIALPVELRLLRARVRARQGEIAAAFAELEALGEHGSTLECDRAEIAFMLGRVERASASARTVLGDASASPLSHARALAVAIDARRTSGDAAGALALTDTETAPLSFFGPLLDGLRAWLRAVTLFDCERYADAAVEVATARAVLSATLPAEATPLLASLERAIDVCVGAPAPRGDEAGDLFDENAFFRCLARLLRAQEHLARGRPRRGAELAEQVWAAGEELESLPIVSWAGWIWAAAACALGEFEQVTARVPPLLRRLEDAGHVPPQIRLALSLAEARLAIGHVAAAVDLAATAHQRAGEHPRSRAGAEMLLARAESGREASEAAEAPGVTGIGAAERSVARAELALDRGDLDSTATLASEVESTARQAGWTELACRAALLCAECALRRGAPGAAREALAIWAAPVSEHGYGMLRVHVAAISAALARADGRPLEGSPDDGAVATHFLSEVGLDREWARRAFARAAARLRLHEPASIEVLSHAGRMQVSRGQLDELPLAAEWVVDRERGEVRRGAERFDLSRRKTLLDVVQALASPPGVWLTAADLASKAWRLDYHALRHHSRLAMAIARLREILGEDAIEGTRDGYRLAAAETWVVVRPTESDPATTPE